MNTSLAVILGVTAQIVPILIILFVAVKNRKNVFDVKE